MGKGMQVGNVKWNYEPSHVLGAGGKPEPTSLASMDAHCLDCDARWQATEASEPERGYFYPTVGSFIITCPHCGQEVTHKNPSAP